MESGEIAIYRVVQVNCWPLIYSDWCKAVLTDRALRKFFVYFTELLGNSNGERGLKSLQAEEIEGLVNTDNKFPLCEEAT